MKIFQLLFTQAANPEETAEGLHEGKAKERQFLQKAFIKDFFLLFFFPSLKAEITKFSSYTGSRSFSRKHKGFFLSFFFEDKMNDIKTDKSAVVVNITVNVKKYHAKRHWKPAWAFFCRNTGPILSCSLAASQCPRTT